MKTIRGIVPSAVSLLFLASAVTSAQGKGPDCPRGTGCHKSSISSLVVKAKPETVYNAIIRLREESKDSVKELSRQGNHSCLLEETFDGLPLIGEAKCVYKEVYTPNKRIAYQLVRSDKFRAFEGEWQLTPSEDGESTNLSLSSYVEVDIPLPFVKQLTRIQTMRGVKQRLHEVKASCENKRLSLN